MHSSDSGNHFFSINRYLPYKTIPRKRALIISNVVVVVSTPLLHCPFFLYFFF